MFAVITCFFIQVDSNIVWQPTNVSANMMECPDLFPLGNKWVLIGSLYKSECIAPEQKAGLPLVNSA